MSAASSTQRGRAFIAASMLLTAAIAYFVITAAHLPLLQYVARERRWAWSVPLGEIGMDWYFRAAIVFVAALIAMLVAREITNRVPRASSVRVIRFVFGLAFGVMLWASLYTALALAATPRARYPGGEVHLHDD